MFHGRTIATNQFLLGIVSYLPLNILLLIIVRQVPLNILLIVIQVPFIFTGGARAASRAMFRSRVITPMIMEVRGILEDALPAIPT